MNITKKLLILLSVALLSGCGTTTKVLKVTAETTKGKGLVVGQVKLNTSMYGAGFTGWQLSYNGNLIGARVGADGYFVTPLAPGKYELTELHTSSSGSMGAVTSHTTRTMPLKANFTVKQGEITNIGKIFLLKRRASSKRYKIIYIKNDNEMKMYLKASHKDVYKLFNNKNFNSASVKYATNDNINKTKRFLVLTSPYKNNYITVAPLGTIAITNRNKQGQIISIKYVNTGSTVAPQSCKFGHVKIACIIPSMDMKDKLFLAHKTKYIFRNKPKQFTYGNFHMLRDNSILWLDDNLSFYRTKNMGKSWTANTNNKRTMEVRGFWDTLTKLPRVQNVTDGKNGFYITSLSDIKYIVYSPYKKGRTVKIKIPEGAEGIDTIAETAKGHYVKTDSTSYLSDSEIYFKANNSNQWLKRVIPKSLCRKIDVDNYNTGSVTVTCRDKFKYQTTDLGKTWTHIN